MTKDYNKELCEIKKHYKNTELLLSLYFENYHHTYLYIRIDYYKKLKTYKLSWLDLAHYHHNFDSIISYEYMPMDMINYIKDLLTKMDNTNLYPKPNTDNNIIYLNSNLPNQKGEKLSLSINQFINAKDHLLYKLTEVIFENLPKKLNCFYDELIASVTGNTLKYKYQEEFTFDLFQGDINELIEEPIKTRGEDYYNQGRVFFLEQLNNTYYAVVGGTGLYVVKINYQEKDKKIKVYCSCPCDFYCKHIYAVILAIRNKKFRKFYKLIPNRHQISLLERVMNFNFLLSIGLDDQGNNYLVIENDQIKLLPLRNKEGSSNWEVFEDDAEGNLTKRLNELLK